MTVWSYNVPFGMSTDDVPAADQWKIIDEAVIFCGQTILEN